MKQMTILYGIFLAIVFAAVTPVLHGALKMILPPPEAFSVYLAIFTIAYTAAIIPRSPRRSGKVFTMLAVGVAEIVLAITSGYSWASLYGSLVVIWFARAVLLSRGVLHAAADGVLVAIAFVGGFAGLLAMESTGFGVWSFMLVLAAGSLIGNFFRPQRPSPVRESKFEQAFLSAERAITSLTR